MQLRIGTSGWSYKDWEGTFYPKGLPASGQLAYLATKFDCVEIDSTFYRVPAARTVEKFQNTVSFRHLDLARTPVPRISIVDDTEALFGFGAAEEATTRSAEQATLWINSRSFVRTLRAYFNEIWSSATPALARLEAMKAGKPEEDL